MEMGFGLCTLAALMWLLWWNGFGEIHEDQLSLRYFREILSFLVLGQLTGVIGILREKWLARAIRNPRWVELGLGLVILVMLAGDFFPFHLYLQNRASEHFPRALPLLRSRPSAEPQGIFFPHRPPEQGLPPPAHSSRPSFPAYPDCLHCAGRNSSHVAGSYQGRHRPFRHGRLFHQHQRRLRHGAGPP